MATALVGLPINGLDHFEAELVPQRWNGFPVPLVPYLYAVQIAEAVGDVLPEPYEGLRPYDGLCWQVICPKCGAPMTLEAGVINEPSVTGWMVRLRVSRPVKFWSCYTCGECREDGRAR